MLVQICMGSLEVVFGLLEIGVALEDGFSACPKESGKGRLETRE